ncbi:MAG: hypothetical protein KZQ77_14640 [Candidatus Thiodiazotropha sp. (ex Notomyrtea botanica)]|nr:hypothetical protein [Candidatus Thiodiazotropha sp. (ex Notomyrtea botanica)]
MEKRLVFLLIVVFLSFSPSLPAHGLNLFIAVEGDTIRGRVHFGGGHGASDAIITISDSEGNKLADVTPNDNGEFSYIATQQTDHMIVADSRDGHVIKRLVEADALVFNPSQPDSMGEQSVEAGNESSDLISASEKSVVPDVQEINFRVEQAVARQMRPLREQLLAHDERVWLRDILGGIGYIIGLAGLGLWWRGRRPAKQE